MSGLIPVSYSTALQNGETSLVKACSRGYATAVKLLLNAGANKAVVNMVSLGAY
jgi:ankyrin repeat protein